MANSSFLTTVSRHRDPRLLWPVAAVASVLTHGLALGLIRTLAIQTPTLPEGAMAPLPIQLVTLPPEQAGPGQPTADTGAEPAAAIPTAGAEAPTPTAAQTTPLDTAPPRVDPAPVRPPVETATNPSADLAAPPVDSPPVAPAPRPLPAPVAPPAAVSPAPPRPAPAQPIVPAPEVSRPPRVEALPRVETPPQSGQPPAAAEIPPSAGAPAPGGGAGQGGQVVPVGLRLDPSGRDIPDTAPQLVGSAAIDMQPLASSCGFANLDALLAGMATVSVQMQVRVETSGEISDARLLQSTGSRAVDDLVSCVVRQRLRLQPASSAGVPQLTDAYILDARIQFF